MMRLPFGRVAAVTVIAGAVYALAPLLLFSFESRKAVVDDGLAFVGLRISLLEMLPDDYATSMSEDELRETTESIKRASRFSRKALSGTGVVFHYVPSWYENNVNTVGEYQESSIIHTIYWWMGSADNGSN